MLQTEFLDQLFDALVLFFDRDLELEPSSKSKRLSDAEVPENNIILHNVIGESAKCVLIQRVPIVELDFSGQFISRLYANSVTQYVEQAGLASTGCAHDEVSLAWVQHATTVF